MIVGEWFSQSSRPLMRSQGSVSQDVATCDLADNAVTAVKVTDGIVSSEKATASLRLNSVLVFLDAATSTEAGGQIGPCSTGNVVWRPSANVNVLGITRYSLGLEEMATCDNFVLYGNAGTCIGGIVLSAGTTNPARGTRTCSGTLTQVALAAGTNVYARRFSSTCSVQARSAFQIDYESSG